MKILENRLAQLFLLAITMMSFSVIGLTLASAIFLQHAGASSLPLAYILMGATSIPLYIGLSQIVDRTNRPQLLRSFLILALAMAIALRLLVLYDRLWVYFILYISFYIQWTLVTEVLFPSLVTDYFTTLDWKRYAPSIRMATALGGLFGGGLTSLLSRTLIPENLILILPLFYGFVFIQLLYLEQTQTPIENESAPTTSALQQPFLELVKQYPIIAFLATSTFLTILLYAIAEFLYFSIYAQTFTSDRQLTSFLGEMRTINSIIPLIVLYSVTQPLLNQIGVMGMNLIYPVTTLLSFFGLGTQGNLIAAMTTNINSNGLEDSLNQPIQSLNYNAVPYHIVGRIRTIGNGLFYSLGLAFAGVLLWGLKQYPPVTIAQVGMGLSVLFLIVRYGMGKSYLQSLLNILRSGSAQLDDVGTGFTRLSKDYHTEIIQLLASGDRQNQTLGLSLASRLQEPEEFLPYIQPLFCNPSPEVRRGLLQFFQTCSHPDMLEFLEHQLSDRTDQNDDNQDNNQDLHLLALEAIIAGKYQLNNSQLQILCQNPNPQIQALAYVAFIEANSETHREHISIQNKNQYFGDSPMDEATKLTLVRAIRSTKNRQFIPYLQKLLKDASLEVTRDGLDVLAMLARPGESDLGELAATQLVNVDPLARAVAFKVMGVVQSPNLLLDVAMGLQHPSLAVRLWAATALSNYGESSLKVARIYLYSPRYEVVEMAIAAIAKVGTRRALNLLYKFLKPHYQDIIQTQNWLLQISPEATYQPLLKTLLQDYQQRIIHRVFYVLSVLDNQHTVKQIQPLLTSGDRRLRANALETLMSVKHQRFIRPILPLLDNSIEPSVTDTLSEAQLIEQLGAVGDRWLRLGALLMLCDLHRPIPQDLQQDPDYLVQRVAQSLATGQQEHIPEQDWFLRQLFFLKQTPLFRVLSLDELEELNRLFYPEDIHANSTIYASKSDPAKLYLIYQGTVTLYSDPNSSETEPIQLNSGQYFGEIAALYNPWYKIITQTDCTFLTLSSKQFEHLIDRCPRLLWCLSQPQNI